LPALGFFDGRQTTARILGVPDSERVLVLQLASDGTYGSRLLELNVRALDQLDHYRVLFETFRTSSDISARAIDVTDDGVVWLFLDSYSSSRRLCRLHEASLNTSERSMRESRWECGDIEIPGAGSSKRSAVTAFKLGGRTVWLGTPFGGVAQAVLEDEGEQLERVRWTVVSWRRIGGPRQGSFERAEWLPRRTLRVRKGTLHVEL
jgi:hypothetical protein